jgi:hypothetical protein
MNDNEPRVALIVGRARRGSSWLGIHIMMIAPDDDTAVRRALDALKSRGFAEVELDRIGELDEAPDEEPHASAYQGALEGEVAIVQIENRDLR